MTKASSKGSNGKAERRGYARAGTRPAKGAGRGAGFWAVLLGAIAIVMVVGGVAASSLFGGGSSGWVEQGNGGSWTNIGPDQLASMMTRKDFTLLNVKTPYIGEIEGTDLYIPYPDLASRRAELPANKDAKIVVYCRAGNESRVALQTLIDLGYTNLWNLDKGMESWAASGRPIVQKSRA